MTTSPKDRKALLDLLLAEAVNAYGAQFSVTTKPEQVAHVICMRNAVMAVLAASCEEIVRRLEDIRLFTTDGQTLPDEVKAHAIAIVREMFGENVW